MESILNIRKKGLTVDVKVTNHNFLRWAVLAIETNPILAASLVLDNQGKPITLTDHLYLMETAIKEVSINTHIILWDGINSYLELLTAMPKIAGRADIRFFAVGWLDGLMLEDQLNISRLYPITIASDSRHWSSFLPNGTRCYAPIKYRYSTNLLSLARYFKNWFASPKRHAELASGGKIVFCGMVTPTKNQINGFFRGVNWTDMQALCLNLADLNLELSVKRLDEAIFAIINGFKSKSIQSASEYACVYSMLNLIHRMRTIAQLRHLTDALFINESRDNTWFDPYDSYFYSKNLYLDFGSTRGPDPIYPRTLDMTVKGKQYISLRFLPPNLAFKSYLLVLDAAQFVAHCQFDAIQVMEYFAVNLKTDAVSV